MKVALVHDYLKEYGGAERVLEALHEIFPEAPVYVAYVNLEAMGESGKRFKSWDIRPSWFQRFPFAGRILSPFRIFGPMMFESFDLSDYDLVISSCAIYFAKAVIAKPGALHISYIHTPPRYLYGYTTSFNYKRRWWTRIGGEIMNHFLRIYDFETSMRPDILIANSKNIQERIRKFYRRDSVVIYPPVDISSKYQVVSSMGKKNYYLSVGRLVRGKGIDVVVEACSKLGLPLKVVGTGPEYENIKYQKSKIKNIELLGQVSDEELPKIYANAKATILASEDEDFGIVALESMAAGTPVIAPGAGGFLETVVPGKTGILYPVNSLMQTLKDFDSSKFNAEDCRKQAEKFSKERFKKEILELVKMGLDKII